MLRPEDPSETTPAVAGPGAADASVPRAVDGSGAGGCLCDLCAATMYDFHCRLICPNCGYQRDCSDP